MPVLRAHRFEIIIFQLPRLAGLLEMLPDDFCAVPGDRGEPFWSGPSPAIVNVAAGCRATNFANAPKLTRSPFFSINRQAWTNFHAPLSGHSRVRNGMSSTGIPVC